jgi:hypothetical protein
MKIVIFVVLAVVVVLVGAVALFPMRMAAEFAAKAAPDFKYAEADGTVWGGKLTGVTYGSQRIGDLAVNADFGSLFTGKAAATVGLGRKGLDGAADLSWPIGGKALDVKNLKLEGAVSTVRGIPQSVSAAGGKFRLELSDIKFNNGACEIAKGEVWTDALAKVNHRGWTGPELTGPVSCEGGKLVVQATGKAPTGEDVVARMDIGSHLDMAMTATVTNATGGAVESLKSLGFTERGGTLVISQAVGS